jgi:hypothetical protein
MLGAQGTASEPLSSGTANTLVYERGRGLMTRAAPVDSLRRLA